MNVFSYDVEIFRNCFTCAVVDIEDYVKKCTGIELLKYSDQLKVYDSVNKKTFIVYKDTNELGKLIPLLNRNQYLVGFNSSTYDDLMFKYILMNLYHVKSADKITDKLYDFSQEIINSQNSGFDQYNWKIGNVRKYNAQFEGIDIMAAFGLNKEGVRKSLKQTSINIKWHNLLDYNMPAPRDEELYLYKNFENPYLIEPWHRYVMDYHMSDLIKYNFNDAMVVAEIFRKKMDDITLRINASNKYGVNVISASESKMADAIFAKYYCDLANLDPYEYAKGGTDWDTIPIIDCIPKGIKFKSIELNNLLFKLQNTIVSGSKGVMEFVIDFFETKYTIASGGLHSVDIPCVFKSDDEYEYIDSDAEAYYPMNVINHRISPLHLDRDTFIKTIEGVVNDRKDSKPNGGHPNKTVDKTLKVVINSGVFGKMGFDFSPIKDLKAMLSVTVSGQLYLLMLIELLESNDFHVISANTDGIITKVPRARKDEYLSLCKQWEDYTKFKLEYTPYKLYIRRDINNYFAVKANDVDLDTIKHDANLRAKFRKKYAKFKGDFNPSLYLEDLRKGYNKPIIAIAIADYFIFDVPVMETIQQSKDIYDFCITMNINRKTSLISKIVECGTPVDVHNQRNSRWYISTDGGYLYKQDKHDEHLTGICKGFRTTIFNQYIEYDDMKDYHLNYGYYYSEAMVIINKINVGSVKGIKRSKAGSVNRMGRKLSKQEKNVDQIKMLFQ